MSEPLTVDEKVDYLFERERARHKQELRVAADRLYTGKMRMAVTSEESDAAISDWNKAQEELNAI